MGIPRGGPAGSKRITAVSTTWVRRARTRGRLTGPYNDGHRGTYPRGTSCGGGQDSLDRLDGVGTQGLSGRAFQETGAQGT